MSYYRETTDKVAVILKNIIEVSLKLLLVFIYAPLSRIYYRNDHDISMISILPLLLSQEPVVPTPLSYRFSVYIKHTMILYNHMLAKSLYCASVQNSLFHVDHIRSVTETTQVLRYSGEQHIATSRGILISILGLKMSQEPRTQDEILCVSLEHQEGP